MYTHRQQNCTQRIFRKKDISLVEAVKIVRAWDYGTQSETIGMTEH